MSLINACTFSRWHKFLQSRHTDWHIERADIYYYSFALEEITISLFIMLTHHNFSSFFTWNYYALCTFRYLAAAAVAATIELSSIMSGGGDLKVLWILLMIHFSYWKLKYHQDLKIINFYWNLSASLNYAHFPWHIVCDFLLPPHYSLSSMFTFFLINFFIIQKRVQ